MADFRTALVLRRGGAPTAAAVRTTSALGGADATRICAGARGALAAAAGRGGAALAGARGAGGGPPTVIVHAATSTAPPKPAIQTVLTRLISKEPSATLTLPSLSCDVNAASRLEDSSLTK